MGKSYTLIITNKFDYCTDSIIKWLKFYNQSFIIIDTNKKVQITKILISNKEKRIELLIDNKNIELKQIDSVVFWKGRIQFDIPIVQLENKKGDYKREVDRFLKRELETITNLIYDDLNKKKIFGLCITKNPNKLILLNLAKEVGLNIPETTISSVSKIIKDKVNDTVSITKPIQEIFNYRERDRAYATFTQIISVRKDQSWDKIIFPSLIQNNIEKKYELRIFYFNDEFYTMAIFSQSDQKTSTDFRDYNYEKPNRMVPFLLPNDIKKKLRTLIAQIGYNSCSTDIIVNKDGDYIFLETNPLGQFDLESLVCNYKIEKKIVEYLKNKSLCAII